MILEGIVTTVSADGVVNIAPMGPRVVPSMDRFLLRPFQTAQTFRNLQLHGDGVLHVTDDVLLLARAALGPVTPLPALRPAQVIEGSILSDACRYYEFRVVRLDASTERASIEVETVQRGWIRDFFGFNRAKHAVVEAAILATRTALLPLAEIQLEYAKLAIIIEKTGGAQEQEAFALLREHVCRVAKGG